MQSFILHILFKRKTGRWIYFLIFFLLSQVLLKAKETGKKNSSVAALAETPLNNLPAGPSLFWTNRNFSFGAGIYSGVALDTNDNFLILAKFNMRIWLTPNLELSFHHIVFGNYSINVPYNFINLNTLVAHSSNPIFMNIGFGNKINNFHWFLEGGGGFNLPVIADPYDACYGRNYSQGLCTVSATYTQILPVLNISAGMEWLISEYYAVGFTLTAMTTFTDFTLLFSLTANIVLGGEPDETK